MVPDIEQVFRHGTVAFQAGSVTPRTVEFREEFLSQREVLRCGLRHLVHLDRLFRFFTQETLGKTFEVLHDGPGFLFGQGAFPGRHGRTGNASHDGVVNVLIEGKGAGGRAAVFVDTFSEIARPGIEVAGGPAAAVAIGAVAENAHVLVHRGPGVAAEFLALVVHHALGMGVTVWFGIVVVGQCGAAHEEKAGGQPQNQVNEPECWERQGCTAFHFHSNRPLRHPPICFRSSCGNRARGSKTAGTCS